MTVVVVLSVLGMAVLVAAGVAGFRIQRSVRRRIVTTRARIAAVQAKAQARIQPPGPRRDAAQLRQRLQAEMRSTKEMLGTAPDGLIFRASATTVLAELTAEASALDAQLAAVDGFLDEQQQRDALTALREQTEQLIATTYAARQTVLRTAVEDRAHRISGLQADVAQQAAALDVYRNGGGELRL